MPISIGGETIINSLINVSLRVNLDTEMDVTLASTVEYDSTGTFTTASITSYNAFEVGTRTYTPQDTDPTTYNDLIKDFVTPSGSAILEAVQLHCSSSAEAIFTLADGAS